MTRWRGFKTLSEAKRFIAEHPDFGMSAWTSGDDWYEATVQIGGMDRETYKWCVCWDYDADGREYEEAKTDKVRMEGVRLYSSKDGFLHFDAKGVFDRRLGIKKDERFTKDVVRRIQHVIYLELRRVERGANL